MIAAPGIGATERFRALVARRLGLRFDDAKRDVLADVLRRRLEALGDGSESYLARLDADPSQAETGALAQELTVAETHFFRNPNQFRALRDIALPDRLRAQAGGRSLQILSAGCASGEEAYSIAILLREAFSDPTWCVSIRAIDLNPAILHKASRASFSAWALRETPPEVQQRWFRPNGREMLLDAAIRGAVTFEQRNLVVDDPELWQPGSYDIVFCRNVLMYFAAAAAQDVVGRIARALAPGGYLFLGHTETLRNLSQDFHLRHTHDTFYYQREGGADAVRPPAASSAHAVTASLPAFAADFDPPGAWIAAIGRASDRIGMLAQAPVRPAAEAPTVDAGDDMQRAIDLLLAERFDEALDVVQTFSSSSTSDAETLLLRAILLAHLGQLDAAERACRRLLEVDAQSAGAHYVLALCRESAQDHAGAIAHGRVAAHLDPGFAMPRLHLGLLASRTGERDSARRDLGQALILLKREDASRLLLFGGGFGREALMALCGAALRECGGRP